MQQELEHKDEFVSLLRAVFEELDVNGSGALSLAEFEKHIDDDKIIAFLSTLEINISEARTIKFRVGCVFSFVGVCFPYYTDLKYRGEHEVCSHSISEALCVNMLHQLY